MDYQEYLKSRGDNAKKKNQVSNKSRRKDTTDDVVKQALAGW